MNLLLLTEADRAAGDEFVVRGERAAHVRDVLGKGAGESLRVGLLEGPVGHAEITVFDEDELVLRAALDGDAQPRPSVDLVLAIPRPKVLRRLLPQIAALGVDRLVLLRTWRVGKPYLTARVLDPSVYRPLLHEGLMQARRTREPRVSVEPLFRPFVEDRAPALTDGTCALVAHPSAPRPLHDSGVVRAERVVVVVGPEGGLLPYEVEQFESAGFTAVSMGENPLRVDTAAVALLAQIDALRRAHAPTECVDSDPDPVSLSS